MINLLSRNYNINAEYYLNQVNDIYLLSKYYKNNKFHRSWKIFKCFDDYINYLHFLDYSTIIVHLFKISIQNDLFTIFLENSD
jgi:hypothetical protein